MDPCKTVQSEIIASSDDENAKELVDKHLAVFRVRLHEMIERLAVSIEKIDDVPFGSRYHRIQLLKPLLHKKKEQIPHAFEEAVKTMAETLKQKALHLRTDTGSGAFYIGCTFTNKHLMHKGKELIDEVRNLAISSGIALPLGGLSNHDYVRTKFTEHLTLLLSYKFILDARKDLDSFQVVILKTAKGTVRTIGGDDKVQSDYKPTALTEIEQRAVTEQLFLQRQAVENLLTRTLSLKRYQTTENGYDEIYKDFAEGVSSMNMGLHSVNQF